MRIEFHADSLANGLHSYSTGNVSEACLQSTAVRWPYRSAPARMLRSCCACTGDYASMRFIASRLDWEDKFGWSHGRLKLR